jgi:CRISPR/Cas system-associated exonuclease Cas4 (RecB family)
VVKLEQQKILQSQNKITKVREGFEGGLYNLDVAKSKVNGYRDTIKKAEQDIERLIRLTGGQNSKIDVNELKEELERLAQVNLDKATFAEKRDIINKLGIRVYPSEDLKTMKIRCSLNFGV